MEAIIVLTAVTLFGIGVYFYLLKNKHVEDKNNNMIADNVETVVKDVKTTAKKVTDGVKPKSKSKK